MKPTLKIFGKTLFSLAEIAGGLFLCFLLLVVFSLWKLSGGPVDVTFAADYVKEALVDKDSGTDMMFGSIVADWPEYNGPVMLGLGDVKLQEKGKTILEVPRLGIKIAKAPLLIGLIKPEAVVMTNPTLKLFRSKAGDFHLFITNAPEPQTIKEPRADVTFQDIGNSFFKGGHLPDYPALEPLSQMEKISVRDASIIVDDHQSGISWEIPAVNFDLSRKTESFDLDLSYRENEDEEDSLRSEISLSLKREKKDGRVEIEGNLHKVDSAILARVFVPFHSLRGQKFVLDGKVDGTLDKDWKVRSLDATLSSDKGRLKLEQIYDLPLEFSNLSAHMVLDRDDNIFEIDNTTLDVNGSKISLSGKKKLGTDDSYFPLTVSIPDLEFATIQKLWPEAQKSTILGEWMTVKLADARLTDMSVTLPVNMDDPTDIPAQKVAASFGFENLKADYRAPMIYVENARGKATIKDDTLDIQVASGKIDALKINKGRVNITRLTHPTLIGDVTINADLTGPLSGALNYIEREPIFLGEEKTGLKKQDVRGQGDMKVDVTFPASKDVLAEQVKVKVDATMNDLVLPKVVRGLDLTGGPFHIVVDDGAFTISGKGRLMDRDIDLTYSEYIDSATAPYLNSVRAKLVTDAKLRDHFGVDLSDFVAGDVPVEIEYKEVKKGQTDVDVAADLTPAEFFVDGLGYTKKAGVKGSATAKALVRGDDVQTIKDLKINIDGDVSANGTLKFGKVGKDWDVAHADFSSVKIGKTSDFSLSLDQPDKNYLDIKVSGKKFDGRPFLSGSKNTEHSGGSGKKQAVSAKVTVDRMVTGDDDDQFLSAPTVTISTNTNGDITTLDLKGKTPNGDLSVALKPDSTKRMELSILSSNAGETLHVLDLYDRMVGGKLEIHGKQISGAGLNDIEGTGQVRDFTVVKAPVLAKLINLFSISGLTELLQNKGIEFSKLKTNFQWKENEKGDRVILLKKGRTSGASIGLSFEGTINQTTGTTNLEGTVVPMSEVNNLVSKIPLIGTILTGGSGNALIAATYTMKGPTEDPGVFLNPLSVLAPGFLRMILFEGDNDFGTEEDNPPSKTESKKHQYNQ